MQAIFLGIIKKKISGPNSFDGKKSNSKLMS